MNKRQKAILTDFAIVITVTVIAVAAMVNFRDWVNHSEAMRAMDQLGRLVLEYRKEHGSVPPESYVNGIRRNLQGDIRLGKLNYRALWIEPESSPDEILAYVERNYNSLFLKDGFIVLRLDGRVEWLGEQQFRTILAEQQSPLEIQMLRK
jgi:hypothetical protein